MICDFCAKPDVRWTHFTEPFSLHPEHQDDGSWAVCDPCHELVIAGDKEGILRRCVQYAPNPVVDGEWRKFWVLHSKFWENYKGFEPMSEEEMNAPHRIVGFHRHDGDFQPRCECGWVGTRTPSLVAAKTEFAAHSGGPGW